MSYLVDSKIQQFTSILFFLQPEKGLVNVLDDVVIYNDPYGVTLVIGAWNYPLQLLLLPMSGAIAGGNTVIVKPSELAVACATFVAETLPKYLDSVSMNFCRCNLLHI